MFKRILGSRWFLMLAGAVVVGLGVGGTVGGRYVYWSLVRQWVEDRPMAAYMKLGVLNLLEQGKIQDAKEELRNQVIAETRGSALWNQMIGIETTGNRKTMRTLVTYLKTDPEVQLDAETRQAFAEYPPFTRAELEAGECRSGICVLMMKRLAESK